MRVKSVTRGKTKMDVYDLEVPGYHNFSVNGGVVVHNCRYALDLDIQQHYKPKVWGVPKAYKRRYADAD